MFMVSSMIVTMIDQLSLDFAALYADFQSPITVLDCGDRCAPYNELGVPFCCDPRHAVGTAYLAEWDFLSTNTDLWHLWEGSYPKETLRLFSQTPVGQVLIACQGHKFCQRQFRSLVCRAFPFFPYITLQGRFIGLAYYWEYEDRCWVISNLHIVSKEYVSEFVAAFNKIFEHMPHELENFRYQSSRMRRCFGRRRRTIPLLQRNGHACEVTPRDGCLRQVSFETLPKFGPYEIAAELPFADEV
jgi:hypothetical protein